MAANETNKSLVTRRSATLLLGGAAAIVGGVYALGVGVGYSRPCYAGPEQIDDDALKAHRRIGEAYLAQLDKNGRRAIARVASRAPALENEMRGHTPLARLHAQVQRDFASGDVVDCDGWMLARTEAEACALLALGYTPSSTV